MKQTPHAVQQKEGETVIFSWITYQSREARDKIDKINEKVMADPRIKEQSSSDMPFDGKRMIYGGFKSIVEL